MRLRKSTSPDVDKATLLAGAPGDAVVLYADDTALILLMLDKQATIRNDDDAEGFVIWSAVSDRFPWAIADAQAVDSRRGATKLDVMEWEGRRYPVGTLEISDVTPVDQSDLSYPGAIAARTPEQYQPYDTFHALWSTGGDGVAEVLESIRRREESEANPTA
jgi:hypothetical protein